MDVETRLAADLLEAHPIDAAQAFEQLSARDVAALFEKVPKKVAAGVVQRMVPLAGGAVLSALGPRRASEILDGLSAEVAALLIRPLDASVREQVLAALPDARARTLRSILRFPEGTAGSLMDPQVLALPHDLQAREALARVREAAGNARYNLYVIDREHRLVGVINLRELLMARPGDPLSSLMKTTVHRLPATAARHAIISHPGWREVHALPVVDESGRYLGAIRYRTLRLLEEQRRGRQPDESATARALGGLLRAGASALVEALSSAPEPGARSTGLGGSADGA